MNSSIQSSTDSNNVLASTDSNKVLDDKSSTTIDEGRCSGRIFSVWTDFKNQIKKDPGIIPGALVIVALIVGVVVGFIFAPVHTLIVSAFVVLVSLTIVANTPIEVDDETRRINAIADMRRRDGDSFFGS